MDLITNPGAAIVQIFWQGIYSRWELTLIIRNNCYAHHFLQIHQYYFRIFLRSQQSQVLVVWLVQMQDCNSCLVINHYLHKCKQDLQSN
ncbi:hypothetical protein H6H03_11775 [Nostoc paludosum FACHB-159]|uniref:Uncharacterized protein n=1 Tax=Nostoc paludosum FACHB-159 TaxID=2692908 RepID=A0ABR8K720_9NOSO|nr:hypothetical protein [Nostoc paludosum FACHB-159]